MSGIPLGWALQRYWPSVLIPGVVVWSIYADWSHTREWKKSLEQKDVVGAYLSSRIVTVKNVAILFSCAIPPYIGKMYEDSEVARLDRYRDRSAMFGRPPPPPGVKEIPSW